MLRQSKQRFKNIESKDIMQQLKTIDDTEDKMISAILIKNYLEIYANKLWELLNY